MSKEKIRKVIEGMERSGKMRNRVLARRIKKAGIQGTGMERGLQKVEDKFDQLDREISELHEAVRKQEQEIEEAAPGFTRATEKLFTDFNNYQGKALSELQKLKGM